MLQLQIRFHRYQSLDEFNAGNLFGIYIRRCLIKPSNCTRESEFQRKWKKTTLLNLKCEQPKIQRRKLLRRTLTLPWFSIIMYMRSMLQSKRALNIIVPRHFSLTYVFIFKYFLFKKDSSSSCCSSCC